jgi:hypothetical protein
MSLITPEDISLVRDSWVRLAAHADALTLRFYEQLFAIDISAAKLAYALIGSVMKRAMATADTAACGRS